MRAIFIAAVLIATLLTFYSALWYKSETIEQDITKRVTEDLTTAGAKDVGIDVDGRHVTLSGVVYDAATEQSYLDTADQTHGALGPIDGLTYVAGTGFVKAVKTAEGITLKGTVPSEDARTALVDAATASADGGTVDDQLTIGAAAGDWEGEASYGLAQMGALSSGALAVAPGSYALSGVASEDDAPIKAAFADRAGWQTFTSSPKLDDDMNARIATLEGDVSNRDQTIAGLTGERDAALGERDALAAERDTLASENGALNGQRTALSGTLAAMTLNRDNALGERDMKQKELDDLRASLDSNQTEVAAIAAARDAAEATVAERDVTITGLNGQITDLTAQNATLTDELETQTAAMSGDQSALRDQLNAQNTKVDTLMGDLGVRNDRIAALEGDLGVRNDRIATLEGDLSDKDAMIGTLKGDLDATTRTIARRDSKIDDLEGRLATREGDVARLSNELASVPVAKPEDDTRVAALTAAVAAQKAEAMALGTKVDDLTAVVAERDATIASLRNAAPTGASSAQIAEQCSSRAGGVLENAKINFRTATADIDRGSVEALERLTGIALACVGDGLTVEIGGHTDSQGSDANNQALSERRAQAILAFMAERGVPTAGLKAVGYGETQPIGDNATREGRAQNRRISFDWQAR